MKRLLSILFAVIIVFALAMPVFAEDYRTDIYRLKDSVDVMSKEEYSRINDVIDEMIPKLKIDLPIYIFDALEEDESFDERVNYFYEHNGFGYGNDKSGVMLALYLGDTPSYGIYSFGEAVKLISDNEQTALDAAFVSDYKGKSSYYDIFTCYLDNVSTALKGNFTYVANGGALPTVIDNADVFTDEEEAELNSRIEKIANKYDVDYVILTVDDNEGYSPEDYTLKFFDETEYGSDGRSAVIFYICFDPSDRAWWTTPKNGIKKYFTERAINDMKGAIEPHLKSGDYYEAALTHISYIEKMASGKYREPIEWEPIIISIIVGAVVGLIVGGIHLSSCKKAMRVVAPVDAHEYLEKDSFILRDKKVYYLYTTVTKTEKPKSNSSSGGGSSYSSRSSSGGGRF